MLVYYLYIEQVAQTVMTGHKRYGVMSSKSNPETDPSQAIVYQIRLQGHLGRQWTEWFGGLTITLEDNGDTLLTGPVVDQAALYGLLSKVRDLGMPLLSVTCIKPGTSTRLPSASPRQARGGLLGTGGTSRADAPDVRQDDDRREKDESDRSRQVRGT